MNKKSKNVSLEDITQKEISIVDANAKIAKFEKEIARDKKIIAEYKELASDVVQNNNNYGGKQLPDISVPVQQINGHQQN